MSPDVKRKVKQKASAQSGHRKDVEIVGSGETERLGPRLNAFAMEVPLTNFLEGYLERLASDMERKYQVLSITQVKA